MAPPLPVLPQLMQVIADRREHPSDRSYTTQLLRGGVEKIGAKIREEAEEVIEAAGDVERQGSQLVVREAADLVYHLCVLLGHCQVGWTDVEGELSRRFGVSGLDEKASRPP